MILQTKISKQKGRITTYNLIDLGEELLRLGGVPTREILGGTLLDYMEDFENGKTATLVARFIQDPQAFYGYLSEKGYALISSKITEDPQNTKDLYPIVLDKVFGDRTGGPGLK